MASLPLAAPHLSAWTDRAERTPAPAPRNYAAATADRFSDFEWSIVAMAERDGLSSLRKPNRFWAFVGLVFGITPANRLANDRLEALRRLAVLAWRYRWNVPSSELQAFFDAGYSPAHYELLQGRIAAAHAEQRRRTAR